MKWDEASGKGMSTPTPKDVRDDSNLKIEQGAGGGGKGFGYMDDISSETHDDGRDKKI